MKKRRLGKNGPKVSALGLGCMGMSHSYGPRDETESLATLRHAMECGVTFFDTADIYGEGANEMLLGKALPGWRDKIIVATKFGFVLGAPPVAKDQGPLLCGRPDYVRA